MLVGTVALAGCDTPTRPERTLRIEHITSSGSVRPDGVAMRATIAYPSDDGGPLRLGAPTLGTVTEVQLNGSPRSASGERVDIDPTGTTADVEWLVAGAVENYADGVIVTLPIWTPPDGVSDDDFRVAVDGELLLPAPPAGPVHWHGAAPADVTLDGTKLRFVGEIATTDESELTFLLPAGSLPGAPVLPGASRVSSFENRQAGEDEADARIAEELADDARREDLEANLYWGLVALEIAIPFLITLIALLRTASVRRRATGDVPSELSDQPSDLAPAVVSLLHADAKDIGADAVAATILHLVQRKVITIEALSGERYLLKVTGGAELLPGESGLLAELPRDDSGAITGPPLPIDRRGEWWRALRSDVEGSRAAAELLRRRYPSGLFLSAVVALAITTAPLYARSPEALVAGVVVATILAAIPFVGGFVLTGAGHRERARWEAYRRHLASADLGDVPAAGVVVWESALVYGAALGVAGAAIEDLS